MPNTSPSATLLALLCALLTACGGAEPDGGASTALGDAIDDAGPGDGAADAAQPADDAAAQDTAAQDTAAQDADTDAGPDDATCQTDPDFFAAELWPAVLAPRCFGCHNASGVAKASKLVLRPELRAGFLDHNFAVLADVAAYEVGGTSIVLQKPLGKLQHGGGAVLAAGDPAHTLLTEFVARLADPTPAGACGAASGGGADPLFAGVERLDAARTFRKAALLLGGRMPTASETAMLEVLGDTGLETALDALLQSEAFVRRVAEAWNDRLLTDRYLGGADAIYALPASDFPNRDWHTYKDDKLAALNLPASLAADAGAINRGIAREPLALIEHVVRNGKPFSEILTADYMMVTPQSAVALGVWGAASFVDPSDADEWVPAKSSKRPHAGILSSPMVLSRFPTTPTNRNRHRSRTVWDAFLATDVMALADRPIDPTGIVEHNPTMFNPDCSVCHAVIDPLAGLFANWGPQGQYAPPKDGWFADMLPPGFEAKKQPAADATEPLRWLGQQIAADPRFATAVVRQAYEMLVGVPVVQLPSDEDASLTPIERAARVAVHKAQQAELQAVAAAFTAAKQDYRVVVRQLVASRWFRAGRLLTAPTGDPTAVALRNAELALLPGAQLLRPEDLDRKLEATLGTLWRRWDGASYLTHPNEYGIFYGGIDSDAVTRRIRSPNGLMAAVQARIANEHACLAVPFDFTLPLQERRLFPYIEANFLPADAYGNPIPAAALAIRETIRRLGWHLLGQRWADGDEDFEELYGFWLEVQQQGAVEIANGGASATLQWWECRGVTDPNTKASIAAAKQITTDPSYTVRAWLAVVTLLLNDAQFLYAL